MAVAQRFYGKRGRKSSRKHRQGRIEQELTRNVTKWRFSARRIELARRARWRGDFQGRSVSGQGSAELKIEGSAIGSAGAGAARLRARLVKAGTFAQGGLPRA